METVTLRVEYKDHDKVVLTNASGDTYTSKSEELINFLHGQSGEALELDCCKPKFKVGDVVYFMMGEMPMEEPVTGVVIFSGEIIRADGSRTKANKPSVCYYFAGLGKIDEESVFLTKDELKESVFKNF